MEAPIVRPRSLLAEQDAMTVPHASGAYASPPAAKTVTDQSLQVNDSPKPNHTRINAATAGRNVTKFPVVMR